MQVVCVTFKTNPKIFYFSKPDFEVKENDQVVVETSRGLEIGIVSKAEKEVDFADIVSELMPIKRLATDVDLATQIANQKSAKVLIPRIKALVKQMKLDMKICFVEYTLDKTKLIINYTAEERVDFRELVKALANEFRSRIEMRQIGNRDEVQYIGAIGSCGRVCCCKSFLGDFEKVSIKMAKTQGLALNPNRINGACGRLLCCLKYEDDFYSDMNKKMPRVGSRVVTPDGEGTVQYNDILHEKVTVNFVNGDNSERKEFDLKDIKFSTINKKNED